MGAEEISRLLEHANTGDGNRLEILVSAAYTELRRIAGGLMRGQRSDHTLQPTALVNEAYLRLVQGGTRWDSKAHFFGAAANAMRQVLVAHARQRSAQKRAGEQIRVTFRDMELQVPEPQLDVLVLDEAMMALRQVGEHLVRAMELRYFAGCTFTEIAEITGRSLASVKRDCAYARAWLYEYMSG